MFKVIFSKTIFNGETLESSTEMAHFKKIDRLPFVPTPEIEIFWGRDKPQSPMNIYWDINEHHFVCYMKDEFHYDIGCDQYDFDWLCSNALLSDWECIGKNTIDSPIK